MPAAVIVPAAGLGSRMGADKALLDLGGVTAIERIAATCRAAGVSVLVVVRRAGAAPLPTAVAAQCIEVDGSGDMAASLRAAVAALPSSIDRAVVFPVDHALVGPDTLLALLAVLERRGCRIALPLFRERPGHPAAFHREVLAELTDPALVLRDLVRADPSRVTVLPVANPWVLADLDRPADLRAACCWLAGEPWSTVAQMFRHRSHRRYRPDPIADDRIERLVDAARHASTSSFIQAYAVVCVRDEERRQAIAALCGGQLHIREAPVFFAVCADLHKLSLACGKVGTTLQSQSLELFLQATVDAALLGQNLQLAAEAEGLGACMIGAARNHPLELARLLALPPQVYVVFGITVGVPADDPVPRGRMPLSGILHWESYDAAQLPQVLEGADEGMRQWARRCNAEQGGYQGRPIDERKGWQERMAASWGEASSYAKARRTLPEELRKLGFGLDG
jgi:nitroreductase/CTP:molybdopterin cytidylyltransferase MocA